MKDLISIPEFYTNKTIFITGGSGFIGKVLIEKLMRSCPNFKKIYILMRSKKDKTPEERLKAITDLPLFDLVRKSNSENFSKLQIIPGDCSELNLGLNPSDRLKLIEETDLIFHGAASVRFDDPLDKSVLLNTRGTRELALLALEMEHLQVLVHISTTYCNTDHSVINEKLYPAHADWRKTIQIAEESDRATLSILTKKYITPLPNTYTFAKHLSEHVVSDLCIGKIPVVIFRPSMIIASHKEPVPGWIDNFYGPIGLLIAGGKGVIHTTYGHKNYVTDYVPVDKVVKAMIISSWKKGLKNNRKTATFCNASYNKITSVTLGETLEMGDKTVMHYPFNNILWYPGSKITSCYTSHLIQFFFYQILTALFIDGLLKLTGHKPILLRIQRKIYVTSYALKYFLDNEWYFNNSNVINQENNLLEEDKLIFGNYAEKIDAQQFLINAVRGVRLYLLKEDDSTLPQAKKHANRMWFVSKIFMVLRYFVIFWILWKIDIYNILIQNFNRFIDYWTSI